MDPVIMDGLLSLFKEAEPVRFGQNLTLFGIAWWMTKGTIKKHFESIEEKLERLADSMSKLEHTLARVEMSHSERLGKLERDVEQINHRIDPDKRSY